MWVILVTLSIGVPLLLCAPSHAEMLTQTPQGVFIKVDNRPLPELIKEIQNKTGIQIKAPDSMKEEMVTVRIEAKNGEEAVELLLRDFNHIKLSGSENEMDRFLLLGGERKGGPIEYTSASLAPSGKITGKKIDPAQVKSKLQAYKERIKKHREEKKRKLEERKHKREEMKSNQRLTGPASPPPTLSGSGSGMQSNTHAPRSTVLKRQSKSIPKKVPAGSYPDPALVQK